MRSRKSTSIVLALVLVVALAGTWAWAQEGGATYYACVNNSSGTIHMLQGPDGTCSNNEEYIVWNSEGPAGPQGPPGPAGPAGPQGEPGACDITRAEFDALVARVDILETLCRPEACNGLDDDCDGLVDEDWDFANDANNCGGCGIVCGEGEWCEQSTCTSSSLDRLVFVTNLTATKFLLQNADDWCQFEACTPGVPGACIPGTFRAWLAHPYGGQPGDSFARFDGPYVLPSGTMVAESWADLTDGTLLHPIDETSRGEPPEFGGRYVWTGLSPDGYIPEGDENAVRCGGWNWVAGNPDSWTGLAGFMDSMDSTWTYGEFLECADQVAHVYCIEQ